ncbi:pre-peptidase C-terminal domain-containing protein [Nocardioides hwasunensis]|uniref:Pre-peptidase C-terminal domain-containing protein n=1 Tax=Nocardioides hwasunensis TaxID=397258 RepID=A0ABR8MD78_9ACTN|nr:pre-peptidase C-terminal domain-containing protein [Nocardioides hwasunensis]MBD3914083.1 pre-peptidase C-terminal domain-containing protein [Nocardioides hwasunensis]
MATGCAGLLAIVTPALSTAAPAGGDGVTPSQQTALDLGIQVADKETGAAALSAATNPNPYLANLPDIEDADYFGWQRKMAADAAARADSAKLAKLRRDGLTANRTGVAARAALTPFVHDEEEPAGTAGSNDSHADAEPIAPFGTGAAKMPAVRILGELTPPPASTPAEITTEEDQGAIPLATDSGIDGSGSATTDSVLGDGPHGLTGDGSNDYDFFAVEVGAGMTLTASTVGSPATTDTILVVYTADGEPVAANDDAAFGTFASELTYKPTEPGTYYVMVGGYASDPLPADPFDSGSGAGGADVGDYTLALSSTKLDADFYSVRLRPGDTIGSTGTGAVTGLTVRTPSGEQRVGGVQTDASSLYPPTSPLPGGGNTTIAYVAEEAGWYSLEVSGATGSYDVTLEAYRPGTQADRGRTQTVLLDFAPGRVNTGTWGGPGVRTVSPFAAFVPQWGISRADARKVENRIVNQVRRNLQAEIAGTNPAVNVEVLNARTNPELIGQENVSRIYVAGTIAETGISTIGIAQYIDPGNFGHQDEAIVLLDVLSAPAGPESSLNTFMGAESDRIAFVSQAVANVTAHEVGHTIGNYHTDNADDVHNMMDSGGANFGQNLYGVGPDNIGGTADDENIEFVTDTYAPVEGFTGEEDTENVTSWAYAGR